jgi:hypothetical protein
MDLIRFGGHFVETLRRVQIADLWPAVIAACVALNLWRWLLTNGPPSRLDN